ncbi:MAG: hypothetical protein CVT93_04330 [Bacteroidetes bacterium HGW-Bacteroidetes-10]|nr:MAG: hypothetical protein CVT93_04330 [Bacteroidetes bacterium HGW-Bacteroidetes-10]
MFRGAAYIRLFLIVFFLSFSSPVEATVQDNEVSHELTIYVIPSFSPIDWSSPSKLYKSAINSYSESFFQKKEYPIGHMFIELRTPLCDSVILTSITSVSGKEQRNMVLKEKVGLSILGTPVEGRMETSHELRKKIDRFSAKKKLAFMQFALNGEAAKRVLEYIRRFTTKNSDGKSPSDQYGGAFWPLFENEGAGCSSFGMSALETTGFIIERADWFADLLIPMDLLGGRNNDGKRVKGKDIKRRKEWHSGEGVVNKDFVPLRTYDPSMIFNWILRQRINPDKTSEGFVPVKKMGTAKSKTAIPGLYYNARNIKISEDNPVFRKRSQASFFIK